MWLHVQGMQYNHNVASCLEAEEQVFDGKGCLPGGAPVPLVFLLLGWGGVALLDTESVKRCVEIIVGGVIVPLHYHCHRAGYLVGVSHNTVEDGVDHAPDIILHVLVIVSSGVDHLCVHLLGQANADVGAASEGARVANRTAQACP